MPHRSHDHDPAPTVPAAEASSPGRVGVARGHRGARHTGASVVAGDRRPDPRGEPAVRGIRSLDHLDELLRAGEVGIGDYWRLRTQLPDATPASPGAHTARSAAPQADARAAVGGPQLLARGPVYARRDATAAAPPLLPGLEGAPGPYVGTPAEGGAATPAEDASDRGGSEALGADGVESGGDVAMRSAGSAWSQHPFAPARGGVDLVGPPESRRVGLLTRLRDLVLGRR